MRREALLAGAFLLAAIAEIQWATAFYPDSMLQAILTFAAGCGLFAVAAGYFVTEGRWAISLGLVVAALAHAIYLFTTLDWGATVGAASALAAVGLALAAGAVWSRTRAPLLAGGLGLAAVGAIVWTVADLQSGSNAYMVGNIFAAIGWGTAAVLVAKPEQAPEAAPRA